MKEKWNMWVPLKKNMSKTKSEECFETQTAEKNYFLVFILFASFSDLRKSDRRNSSVKNEKCSTRRGLRMGTKNTGFHREFR